MAKLRALSVTVTTDASGDAVGTIAGVHGTPLDGYILSLIYTKDDFADGVDFDVVTTLGGLVAWDEDSVDASKTIHPRLQVHTNDGVAAVLTSGSEPYLDRIPLCGEGIEWTVANGGDSKSGTLTLLYEEVGA